MEIGAWTPPRDPADISKRSKLLSGNSLHPVKFHIEVDGDVAYEVDTAGPCLEDCAPMTLPVTRFRAFRLTSADGRVAGAVTDLSLDDLRPGEVVVRTACSSVNYKDALAATGAGKIVREFPLVGGIDLSGTVVWSTDGRFVPGDQVLATGYGLGVTHDGGYAEYARVPADWLLPLPEGLSVFDAMVLGTAGFTAGLAIVRLERHGIAPGAGPVAVTGATGGVGSIAVAALARAGYHVTAITGKKDAHQYLKDLGAREVIDRHTLDLGTRPLEKAVWSAAIDAVGGDLLSWLTRTADYGGAIASTGLTGGTDLHTTVMPFILRGVALLGIDSVLCPMVQRREVWRRLATDLRPPDLTAVGRRITLETLPQAFAALLAGEGRGRFVVELREARSG
jgi:NADPH2:quinone reductase